MCCECRATQQHRVLPMTPSLALKEDVSGRRVLYHTADESWGQGRLGCWDGQRKREAATNSSLLLWHFIPNYCHKALKQLPKVLFKLLHQQRDFSPCGWEVRAQKRSGWDARLWLTAGTAWSTALPGCDAGRGRAWGRKLPCSGACAIPCRPRLKFPADPAGP